MTAPVLGHLLPGFGLKFFGANVKVNRILGLTRFAESSGSWNSLYTGIPERKEILRSRIWRGHKDAICQAFPKYNRESFYEWYHSRQVFAKGFSSFLTAKYLAHFPISKFFCARFPTLSVIFEFYPTFSVPLFKRVPLHYNSTHSNLTVRRILLRPESSFRLLVNNGNGRAKRGNRVSQFKDAKQRRDIAIHRNSGPRLGRK